MSVGCGQGGNHGDAKESSQEARNYHLPVEVANSEDLQAEYCW